MSESIKQIFDLYVAGVIKKCSNINRHPKKISYERIKEIQINMNVSFTEEMEEWYQLIGEANFEVHGFFYGMTPLSVEDVYQYWEKIKKMEEKNMIENVSLLSSVPKKYIKLQDINSKWIPLAKDVFGFYIGVDLDPDKKGKIGQIINFGIDELVKFVLFGSIKEMLLFFIEHQEQMVNIKSDGVTDEYINSNEINSIDFINRLREEYLPRRFRGEP